MIQKLELVFLDGQFPSLGRSDVEGIFDPPYYEWFQANEVVVQTRQSTSVIPSLYASNVYLFVYRTSLNIETSKSV